MKNLTTSPTRRNYERIVAEYLAPCLERHGYPCADKGFGEGNYARLAGDVKSHVCPHLLRHGPSEEGLFELFASVGFLSLGKFLRRSPIGERVLPRQLPGIGGDVTAVMIDPSEVMSLDWMIYPDTDVNTMGGVLIDVVSRVVLPFLDRFGALDAVVYAWEQGDRCFRGLGTDAPYFLAAAYWTRGSHEKACNFLRDLLRDRVRAYKGWFTYREAIAEGRAFLKWLETQPR